MKNIHLLPTDKPSKLQKNKHNKLFLSEEIKSYSDSTNQNIYITSDEEIKEGDWCFLDQPLENGFPNHQEVFQNKDDSDYLNMVNHLVKKIILTTDQELIKDGVQAIDDEFLEWFVKNPSCESVKTYLAKVLQSGNPTFYKDVYKIIIPKEETNYNMKKEILIEMMNQDEELGLYEETVEEYFLSSIKNMLQFNNDALAIRLMEKYYHAKKQQDETNTK
jgi:hypothetical protein